jgi:protein-S-isoprenylcysteine O-methyltransferase Ste14
MITKLIAQTVVFVAVVGAMLFALAGRLDWPGAWVLLASLGGGGIAMGLWLARRDPALLKERMGKGGAEKKRFDRIILPLTNIVLFAWIAAMALAVRFDGPATLPLAANLAGGAAIIAAFLIVIRVMAENTFATTFVRAQPERGQKVIDTGPYAVVRHPMYSAALLAYAAIPFALGSKAGLLGIPLPVVLLGVRIVFEEGVLCDELPGYRAYTGKVRYRLVPYIW